MSHMIYVDENVGYHNVGCDLLIRLWLWLLQYYVTINYSCNSSNNYNSCIGYPTGYTVTRQMPLNFNLIIS